MLVLPDVAHINVMINLFVRGTSTNHLVLSSQSAFITHDRVALGRYRPRAPTDPYVRTLPHTVHQIMVSLRVRKLIAKCEVVPTDIVGADDETSAKS